MITDAFDSISEAIISPEQLYGVQQSPCDVCIATFSQQTITDILATFSCEKIAQIESVNGAIPCYKLNYKGKEIAFYMTMVGSAGAAACLEDARCLLGSKKFILFGSCGCLNQEVTAGKIIVPTDAYRDEGLSYHYVAASDYIKLKNADVVAAFFRENEIPYVTGKTWTTDGVYRETRGNMEKRKAEGCITVEMESAGLQAVCDFRKLEFYQFLIGCDLLDSPEWDRRILGEAGEHAHQLKGFYLALELALNIG